MAKAVGIDLGTTNSVISIVEGGKPDVIVNSEGTRTTPSVVAFKGADKLVGNVAKRQAPLNPTNTFFEVKRFIGRRWDEVREEAGRAPFKVVEGPNGSVRVETTEGLKAPEEISAMVLRKMVDDASSKLGYKVTDVVITVPAYFDNTQREATAAAGKIAGLNVLRIINEPTAAALSYGLDKKGNEKILVFDLGGGTFDVTVLEIGDGVFEVKSTNGDTHLGGADIDQRIVSWLAKSFEEENKFDLRKDPQALQRLIEASEKAKIELSSALETSISLPFITFDPETRTPLHLEKKLTRAQFENLVGDLFERCRKPVLKALEDAKLSASQIDEVILVGGSTRIPAVKALVEKLLGKTPNESVNPDEAVALGAAVQAAILSGDDSVGDIVLVDVTPLTLGVEVKGGLVAPMISRNTAVPAKKTEIYTTADNNQPGVEINILQGERSMANDNKSLGRFKLEGIPPMPAGIPQIEVTFDLDANGILRVSAKEKSTGKEANIRVENTTTLGKDEIDRMVRDAELNAETDKANRERIEKRNGLDALRINAEKQITESASAPQDLKDKVQSLSDEAKLAIQNDATDDSKIEQLQKDLEEALRNLMQAATQNQPSGETANTETKKDDDVIDADFKPAG
ncbi:MAG: DnaK-like protein [Deinococcota bacterium]|jgi:molecular chaperone DnaK